MNQSNTDGFLIAALGASAGGLEALEKFFKNMPADAGIAFTVVQHLAPNHSSLLPELLARHTRMTVEQARDNTKIVPNRVYIIPPNATLKIKGRKLRVTEPAEPRGHRTPIDSLFSSLAEDCGENAVCIMLSGTGTDGTVGLRAIKEHGGMAMAQTLESAQYDTILRSAIATGLVDHVLPVEEMPAKLLEYAAHLHSLDGKPNGLREQTGKHLDKIHGLLRQRAGHDFSHYKESTIARRLERRMKALQIATVEGYLQTLEAKPEEADRLFKDLLIGVTQFFRDPEAFESLRREVIPKLFEGKGVDDQIRVSIIGCASGEEAYSTAILLREYGATLDSAPKIQIFATDIDDRGLETARKGRYPESVAEYVSAERLERFFTKQDGAYQVNRELRELCIFSSHSFIKDPPFSRLDLISCRNVMIYLGLDLQEKVLPLFHYALRSSGYLFLGPSEHITSHKELFRTIDKKHRIFQRKESVTRPAVKFPFTAIGRAKLPDGKPPETDERNLPKELERVIVQRYAPACVVVKENGEAVFFSGKIGRYLEHPAGSPETNVINMAREGLRIPLRTSLHRAVSSHQRVVQTRVSVQVNGGMSPVVLTVEPLPDLEAADLYMIVLEEVAPGPQQGDAPADAGLEETIRSLEGELRLAQEHAQSAYEELETSNEELQSANEEYQSTNEELETSKEELQSFNEELETVNTELNRRVIELEDARIYAESIVDTVREPLLVLDADLRVKSANHSFYKTFGLVAHQTVNRLLYDLGHRDWDLPELRRLLSEVPEKKRLEDFRMEHEFSNIGRITMLLNARLIPQQNGEATLILLAIEDITARSRAEASLQEANQDLKHFAYAASHDLQEPLRMVTSYTQLLAKQYKGKLDSLADQSIAYAVEGAHQMEMLLKGLRDYWAVNEEKAEENIVIDCNLALEEALAYLKGRIQESGAVINHDSLPSVMAEDIPLVLLFKNLVSNALKFARPGEPPRIHISAQRIANEWSFSVRDHGIGIEPAYLENIFIPFKRLHSAEDYAGSGLGLAICQRIVKRYKGRIWAVSTYGQGSTFHFTIPLQGGER